jgi:RHS repeat-associated protein
MRVKDDTKNLVFYLFADHLGSTNVTSDPSGQMVSLSLYKPWGESRGGAGTSLTDYAYTGQRNMDHIGLDWYGSRWYDDELGRFINPNTVVQNPLDPIDYDRFAYVHNNSIRLNDPSGHDIIDTIGEFVTGFVKETDRSFLGYTPQLQSFYGASESESDVMLIGRLTSDVAQVIVGVMAIDTGSGGILTGAAACGTGVGCPGGVVVIAGGAVIVGVGAVAVVQGAAGIGSNVALMTGKNNSGNSPIGELDNFLRDNGWTPSQHFLEESLPADIKKFGYSSDTVKNAFLRAQNNQYMDKSGRYLMWDPKTGITFAVDPDDKIIKTVFTQTSPSGSWSKGWISPEDQDWLVP